LRARDHLERKRAQERKRREREQRRGEKTFQGALLQRLIGPFALGMGFIAGAVASYPFIDDVLLRDAQLARVEIDGNHVLTPDAIVAAAGLEAGASLGTLDSLALAARLEEDPWIESARTLRLPDGGLLIRVEERRVVARWQATPESDHVLIDPRGRAFVGRTPEIDDALELPLVRGPHAGEALPGELLEILEALDRIPSFRESPSQWSVELPGKKEAHEGYVLQVGAEGPRVLIGQTLLRERIARLASLLENVELELDASKSIDLRYADRAVLQTEPASG
jgi:cell division septal protein FtsQ